MVGIIGQKIKSLLCSELAAVSLFVHLQKVCDQLDCLCGDLLPGVRWVPGVPWYQRFCIHATLFLCHLLSWILEQRKNKNLHEGGVLDLLVDILVLIERESAGEGDVDDHTSAPHVQWPDALRHCYLRATRNIFHVLSVCYGDGGAKKPNSDSEYPILLFAQNCVHHRNQSV